MTSKMTIDQKVAVWLALQGRCIEAESCLNDGGSTEDTTTFIRNITDNPKYFTSFFPMKRTKEGTKLFNNLDTELKSFFQKVRG